MSDLIALNAIGLGANGCSQLFFGGAKDISRIILKGDLDPFMTQPKNLVLHLIGSKSLSKGWGHLMTSLILILLGNFFHFSNLLLILLSIICGSLIFTSFAVIAHSLVFWLGPVEGVSKKYCESLFLFALYPSNIYSGLLQVIMFTLIPAGFISYLPVELIRTFSWFKLTALICGSVSFLILAFSIFHLGLKRYESGNQFGVGL